MKNLILIITFAILTIGCTKDNLENKVEDTNLMNIEVLHPSATRVTNTAFESGDVIGVYVSEYDTDIAKPLQISGNWANNVPVTYNGANWNPAKKIFWSDSKMDIYGYYPYMKPTSIDQHLWSVQLDQSTPATETSLSGYEASDLLWAKATGMTQSDESVQLRFKHLCAKMVIKLLKGDDFTSEFPEDTEVYLHSTIPAATIDFEKGIISKDIYGARQKIKARKVSVDTFEVILIPQSIQTSMPFIEVIMGDIAYMTEDMFSYRPGVQYEVGITLNSSPDKIEIDLGGNVTWQ